MGYLDNTATFKLLYDLLYLSVCFVNAQTLQYTGMSMAAGSRSGAYSIYIPVVVRGNMVGQNCLSGVIQQKSPSNWASGPFYDNPDSHTPYNTHEELKPLFNHPYPYSSIHTRENNAN